MEESQIDGPQMPLFEMRPGVANTDGVLYERRLTTVLFLRSLQQCNPFYLASNVKDIGNFDDIVLFTRFQNRTIGIFLQLKHKDKNLLGMSHFFSLRGDTSLFHHFKSYQLLKQQLQTLICNFYNEPNEVEILPLLYTNARIVEDEYVECPPPIEDSTTASDYVDLLVSTEGQRFFFPKGYMPALKELTEYKKIVTAINTGLSSDEIRKMVSDFEQIVQTKSLLNKILKYQNKPTAKDLKNLLSEVEIINEDKEIFEFLDKLRIYHCQANVLKITNNIKEEMDFLCGTNDLFSCLENEMEVWSRKNKKYFLTQETPFWKKMIMSKIDDIIGIQKEKLMSLKVFFKDEEIIKLKSNLENKKFVHIICDENSMLLSALKVYQMFVNDKLLIIDSGMLSSRFGEINWIWKSECCQALIVLGTPRDEIMIELTNILYNSEKFLYILTSEKLPVFSMADKQLVDQCELNHLCENSILKLNNISIKFQGQKTSLRDHITANPGLLNEISGNDLLNLIRHADQEFVIGKELPPFISHYIPISVTRQTYLNTEFLECILSPALCIVEASSISEVKLFTSKGKEVKNYLDLSEEDLTKYNGVIYIPKNLKQDHWDKICQNSKGRTIHWVAIDGKSIRWVRSTADIKSVSSSVDKNFECVYTPNVINDIQDRCVSVVGEAGSGKSTLLTYLAFQTKISIPGLWIVRINLNDYANNYFHSTNFENVNDVVSLLESAVYSRNPIFEKFEKLLFLHSLKTSGNVAVLLDGCDEVCSQYRPKIKNILKHVVSMKIEKIWVTTRLILRDFLQEELLSLAFTVKSLNEEQQRLLLYKYWKSSVNDEARLCEFIGKLLVAANKFVEQDQETLLQVPLYVVMLAEAFQRECIAYCGPEKVDSIPESLSLCQLYETFIMEKYKIVFVAKANMNEFKATTDQFEKTISETYTTNHMRLAVELLLSQEERDNLSPYISATILNHIMSTEQLEKAGIITVSFNAEIKFVHYTFAEYFFALWLTKCFELYKNQPMYLHLKQSLVKILSQTNFILARKMFDRILCKDCILHNKVLNREIEDIERIICSKEISVNAIDHGGRTPLHLAASFGLKEAFSLLLKYSPSLNITDHVFGWTPIQFAAETGNWEIVEGLLQTGAPPDNVTHVLNENVVLYSAGHGLLKLLKLCLIYNKPDGCGQALLIAIKNKQTAVINCLIKAGFKDIPASKEMNEVFTEIYKTTAIALQLLTEKNYSPLHLAATGDRLGILSILIQSGWSMTKCSTGNSPLDHAKDWGHIPTIAYLEQINNSKYFSQNNSNSNISSKNHKSVLTDIISCFEKIRSTYYESGNNLLHWATLNGDLETVTKFFNENDVNIVDNKEDSTLLHLASISGSQDVLTFLIKKGMHPNIVNCYGSTGLHWACAYGNAQAVLCLLKSGANPNCVDNNHSTPLHWAAASGSYDIVKILLDSGCKINQQNLDGCTALHLAAKGGHVSVLITLLDKSADPNITDNQGCISLHYAAENGETKAVDYLLQYNVEINHMSLMGLTPLHHAIIEGHFEIVKNLQKCTNLHQNLLHWAGKANQIEILKYLLNLIPVDSLDENGSTPLYVAASKGHSQVVNILLLAGADPNRQSDDGSTPLHWAATTDNLETVEALLTGGAWVDGGNKHGCTPLHWSSRAGCLSTVNLLLKSGADPNGQNKNGCTALSSAVLAGHKDIVEVLLEAGADPNIPDYHGCSPLKLAEGANLSDIVSIMYKKSISTKQKSSTDNEPLNAFLFHKLPVIQMNVNLPESNQNKYSVERRGSKILSSRSSAVSVSEDESGYGQSISEEDSHRAESYRSNSIVSIPSRTPPEYESAYSFDGSDKVSSVFVAAKKDAGSHGDNCDIFSSDNIFYSSCLGNKEKVSFFLISGIHPNSKDVDGSTALHYAAKHGHEEIVRLLLEWNADVNICDDDGSTPVHCSVRAGHSNIVNLLLKSGGSANVTNNGGVVPLHWASISGHTEIVRSLLQFGADPNKLNSNKSTSLYLASSRGHAEIIELLLAAGADANSMNIHGFTSLHYAARAGYMQIVKNLTEYGADVNKANNKFCTPLHWASKAGQIKVVRYFTSCNVLTDLVNWKGDTALALAVQGGYTDVVQCLLEAGSDPNIVNFAGEIPLHIATKKNAVEIMRFLLKHGAVVDLHDKHSFTALHWAASQCETSTAECLRDYHADPLETNNEGITPLDISLALGGSIDRLFSISYSGRENLLHQACKDCLENTVSFLLQTRIFAESFDSCGLAPIHYAAAYGHVRIISLLISYGVSVNQKSETGESALCLAVKTGQFECAKYLIENGADHNFVDSGGCTLLHISAKCKSQEMVKLLLEHNLDVNATDSSGNTPVHYACLSGSINSVQLLMAGGADLSVKNSDGHTVFDLASKGNYIEIISLLLTELMKSCDMQNTSRSLLFDAAATGNVTLIDLLVNKGYSVNEKYYGGVSLLHVATSNGHNSCVRKLLEFGAEVNAVTESGTKVVEEAIKAGCLACVETLLEFGADMAGTFQLACQLQKMDIVCFLVQKQLMN